MQTTIHNFLAKALNQPLWNVRVRLGSMLVFEIGDAIESDRGEYHFSLDGCHWWLQRDENGSSQDIIHSESDKEIIESAVKVLEGKKLLSIQLDEEMSSAVFDFDDGYFLKIAPYGSTTMLDQWKVFTPNEILTVFSNSTAEFKEIK